MEKRNVAVILLYDDKKRVLLQHRDKDAKRLPDYWAFFGGGIEKDEAPEDTVKREALEELDYPLNHPRLVMVQDFKDRKIFGKKHVFMEEYDPGKRIMQKEGQNKGWFSIDETSKLKIADHDLEVLEYIKDKF